MSTDQAAPRRARLPRTALLALWFAVGWCLLLVAGAFTFPVYATSGGSSGGSSGTLTGTATLVEVNGLGVVAVLAVPLAIAVLVGVLLRLRLRRAAWAATALLGVLTVIGLVSIGLFVLPATIALVVACSSASSWKARTVEG